MSRTFAVLSGTGGSVRPLPPRTREPGRRRSPFARASHRPLGSCNATRYGREPHPSGEQRPVRSAGIAMLHCRATPSGRSARSLRAGANPSPACSRPAHLPCSHDIGSADHPLGGGAPGRAQAPPQGRPWSRFPPRRAPSSLHAPDCLSLRTAQRSAEASFGRVHVDILRGTAVDHRVRPEDQRRAPPRARSPSQLRSPGADARARAHRPHGRGRMRQRPRAPPHSTWNVLSCAAGVEPHLLSISSLLPRRSLSGGVCRKRACPTPALPLPRCSPGLSRVLRRRRRTPPERNPRCPSMPSMSPSR
jgi:hypothetical protein